MEEQRERVLIHTVSIGGGTACSDAFTAIKRVMVELIILICTNEGKIAHYKQPELQTML